MIRFALALILCFASTATAQIAFEPIDPGITSHLTAYKAANPNNWWSWGLKLGDINGDGKLDVYMNTHQGVHGFAYVQGENLQFSYFDMGRSPRDMPNGRRPYIADFTGNGLTDLITAGSESASPTLLQMNPGPNVVGPHRITNETAQVLDLNGDGYLDVTTVTKDYGISRRVDYINQAPASYAFAASSTQIAVPDDLPQELHDRLVSREGDQATGNDNRWAGPEYWRGDLNGDGREDCIVQYFGSYSKGIYRFGAYLIRNEDGNLVDVTQTCGIPPHLTPLLPPANVTGNGKLDIVTSFGSQSICGLYAQQDGNTFILQTDGKSGDKSMTVGAATYHSTINYLQYPVWTDLDGDGDTDLVLGTNRWGRLFVFENQEGYLRRVGLFSNWDARGWDIGDVDGDGKLDLVVGSGGKQAGTTVTIYRNVSVPPVVDPDDPDEPDPEPVLKVTVQVDGVISEYDAVVRLNSEGVGQPGDTLEIDLTSPVDHEEPEVPTDPDVPTDPTVINVTPDTISLVENATTGQSFLLKEGTYRPFYIRGRHGLYIRGEPGAIVAGRGTEIGKHAVIIRECHGVTIDGLHCTKGNAGIGAYASHNLTIRNCTLVGNDTWGVFTSVCDDTVIQDCIFTDNFSEADPSRGQHGIYISNSSQRPVIERNTSTGHKRAGIQINGDRFSSGKRDGVTHGAVVRDNILTNNKIGLNLDGCSDSLFEGNTVDDGMRFFKIDGGEASSRNIVRNNHVFEKREQSAVLVLDGSKDNIFESNIIEIPMTHPSWAHGIAVEEGDRDSSMISRFNRFIVPGHPFGGGQFGKNSRTLEEMGDEGSTVERK